MTLIRMSEANLNASLDSCLHGAQAGDSDEARHLHTMLDSMLTERDGPGGRMWLTEHGREVLAEMHRNLSHCDGGGEHLHHAVMQAVRLQPREDPWTDNCRFVRELRVAIAVANELCVQRDAGGQPDLAAATRTVANRGDFDLSESRIREIYDGISSAIGGFTEIARC